MRSVCLFVLVAGCWTSSPPPPAAPIAAAPARPAGATGNQGYGGQGYAQFGMIGVIGAGSDVDPSVFGGLAVDPNAPPQGQGTIGIGGIGSIGTISRGRGSGYGVLGGRAHPPTVAVGTPNAQGDLDKAIIRRYIKRNIQKIQYCYEKTLLAKPGLGGKIETQFTIGVDGKVTASSATGVDPDVASCIALVIKDIEFPAPKGGGVVNVNYPFVFAPAVP